MRLPDLLRTKNGRLTAFFFLYVTEGIPLGFAATAVATQLRRQGVGPAEIGAFVASFYLPWAFKWAFGPLIDVFSIERLGRRRGWIIGTQLMMAVTLLSTVLLKLPQQLGLFTVVLLVHNTFGAMQDVAIDALAVNTLQEDERGTANGVMFAGASIGQAVGGSGVLFLMGYANFQSTFFFVAAAILAVTVLVVLPMREAASARRVHGAGSPLRAAAGEMRDFAVDAFRSFLGTRGAFGGLLFSLLPFGAMSLGLALQSNLAVELGMSDDSVAWLQLWSLVIMAGCCVLGGWLSDRYGRRRMLALYIASMSVPVLVLMQALQQQGWVMPVAVGSAEHPTVAPALLLTFWITTLVYNAFQGLMYGTRSAIAMDVTNPAVAATQFTAYMALANLVISYSAAWQGIAIEALGYPKTLLIDAVFGLVSIALIPLLKARTDGRWVDGGATQRARWMALVLGLLCLAWPAYAAHSAAAGAAQPIVGTAFTLVFIGATLFLLAAAVVVRPAAPVLARAGRWIGVLLLAMHLRDQAGTLAGWLAGSGDPARAAQALAWAFDGIALAGGIVLLLCATHGWRELLPEADTPALAAVPLGG